MFCFTPKLHQKKVVQPAISHTAAVAVMVVLAAASADGLLLRVLVYLLLQYLLMPCNKCSHQ